MKTKIYFLASSEDSTQIKYIGKTKNSLKIRLTGHIHSQKISTRQYHTIRWIHKVIKHGFKIEIMLISEVDGNGCKEEIVWIAYGKSEGWKLTNSTNGGEGCLGYKRSQKLKDHQRIIMTGKFLGENNGMFGKPGPRLGIIVTDDIKKKQRIAHLGKPKPWLLDKPLSKNHRLAISNSRKGKPSNFKGHHHTKESIEKWRIKNTGRKDSMKTKHLKRIAMLEWWKKRKLNKK